ncbi:MAG: hypothetical protein DWI30_08010 [Chloroflexi bacterium]|nr:MAG: hypothetical protein DWI30_08010 [Chloroflexota bacterium]
MVWLSWSCWMMRLVVVVSAKKSVGAGRGSALTVTVAGGVGATAGVVVVGMGGIGAADDAQPTNNTSPINKTSQRIHPRIDSNIMPYQRK